jgi:hypothetical protein
MSEFLKLELPLLVNLPVYQEIHCSQQLTDQLCAYVWEHKPEFIKELAENETFPFPNNRDFHFTEACNSIKRYLENQAQKNVLPKLSMLGMIDFIYEIDRRVRKALNLFDIPVVGKPLAISPEGPFQPLINLEIQDSTLSILAQKDIDNYVSLLYSRAHKIVYALCEDKRRLLRGTEALYALENLAKEVFINEKVDSKTIEIICAELNRRLVKMCDIPNVKQLETLVSKGPII